MTHVTAQLGITRPRLSSPKDSEDSDLTLPRACLPESRPKDLPAVTGATVHSSVGTSGIFLSRPLAGPKSALSRSCAAAPLPSLCPTWPPPPVLTWIYPAQPGPNRPARPQPPPLPVGFTRELSGGERAVPSNPGGSRGPAHGASPCSRASASGASLCWPSEALPRSPRTRWQISCGPRSTALCMLLPNASNSLSYAHIH